MEGGKQGSRLGEEGEKLARKEGKPGCKNARKEGYKEERWVEARKKERKEE